MTDPVPHKLAAQQARFNRSTRGHWEHFASHRDRIAQLLVADGLGGSGRLCVLGAGNCNDLDLKELAEVFTEVHLVDLDPAAPAEAVRRQGASPQKVRVHAPVDLSAAADVMATWPGRRPEAAAVEACLRRIIDAPLPSLGGPFNVVLSPCVLSQIVGYTNDTLGTNHPRTPALRAALRDRHLRVLTGLVAPGGWGLLVTDLVSSNAEPGLPGRRYDELPGLLRTLVGRGRGYPGLDPDSVRAALERDPLTTSRSATSESFTLGSGNWGR